MRILAHRGASGYAPENTFAAFELATQMAADAIETDVRLTRDGVLILLHDPTVDRTTTGAGKIQELSWAELHPFDAGFKFHPHFVGEKIPKLADFLDRFLPRIPVCLEIKTAAAVPPLLALLESRNLTASPRLEFTSFNWEIIVQLHQHLPGAAIGYLTHGFTHEVIDQIKNLGLAQICPPAKDASPELVAHAHRSGLTVRTSGAKSREVLQHILQCGVDGTTLNHPDWITRKNGSVTVVPEATLFSAPAPHADP